MRGDELKKDHGKPMWDLLPLNIIEGIVNVLTFGANKYTANSWQNVDNAENRYFAALMRHLSRYQSGEQIDQESGINHLHHAACNIVFLMWFEERAKAHRLTNGHTASATSAADPNGLQK